MLSRPRYTYIQHEVLKLFRSLPVELLQFPFDAKSAIKTLDKCKVSSYECFARQFSITVDDVMTICDSRTGCTHYQQPTGKYLVLYNNSCSNYNVDGRQLWTLAHELGHIVLKHLTIESVASAVAENSFCATSDPIIEAEADYFAATVLAPFPILRLLNVKDALDVQYHFGLSTQASDNRWEQYVKWEKSHIKKAFENDLLRLFSPILLI